MVFASLSSGAAGVILEKLYKSKFSHDSIVPSVWARNLQLSIISTPFALAGVVIRDHPTLTRGSIFKDMMLSY